jgi:hypothetical protein
VSEANEQQSYRVLAVVSRDGDEFIEDSGLLGCRRGRVPFADRKDQFSPRGAPNLAHLCLLLFPYRLR